MQSRRLWILESLAFSLGLAAAHPALQSQSFAVQQNSLPPLQRLKKPRVTDKLAKELADRLRELHVAKLAPKPGDWLANHKEAGQSFGEYLNARSERHCERFKKIYVQPLGEFDQKSQFVLPSVKEMLEACFGLSVVLRKAKPLGNVPAWAKRGQTDDELQLATPYVMDQLLKIRPVDAVAVLGLLTTDLYPDEKWNFVFGIASLEERIGIWSTARLGTPDGSEGERDEFLKRTLKVAIHETGHMFGMPHCITYECGMNGSNSLAESDRQEFAFCPECQAKIWWTCDYPAELRLKRMESICKRLNWGDEQAYYEKALKLLTGTKS